MFWKIVKWGGTALFILMVAFIGFAADSGESDGQTQANQPTQQPIQPGKKFNF
jgi:hypothetical protein